MIKSKTAQTAFAAALALSLGTGVAVAAPETHKPIKIVTIESADADFIAHVYGEILQKVGYNVEYVRVDYTAQFAGLETGDLHVSTAAWDTSSWQQVVDTVSTGLVTNYGSTGVRVKEGWWYPSYMTEFCPGLPDWKALKTPECVAALSTVETAPKGRYVDAPADWQTEARDRMKALELDLEVISSGSPVTLVATVRSAIDRKEPILAWGYRPHWFYDSAEGGYVDLPRSEGACFDDPAWGPNPDAVMDCGYAVGYIWKLGSKEFGATVPGAARILHLFNVDTKAVAAATGRVENDGESLEAVAAEWVEQNASVWSSWVD